MHFRATLPLDELRKALQGQVNALRAEKIAAGYEHAGHRYQIDDRSVLELSVRLAGGWGNIDWRTADNQTVRNTRAGFEQLANALLAYRDALNARAFALKDAIEASPDPSGIDIRGGWPE